MSVILSVPFLSVCLYVSPFSCQSFLLSIYSSFRPIVSVHPHVLLSFNFCHLSFISFALPPVCLFSFLSLFLFVRLSVIYHILVRLYGFLSLFSSLCPNTSPSVCPPVSPHSTCPFVRMSFLYFVSPSV